MEMDETATNLIHYTFKRRYIADNQHSHGILGTISTIFSLRGELYYLIKIDRKMISGLRILPYNQVHSARGKLFRCNSGVFPSFVLKGTSRCLFSNPGKIYLHVASIFGGKQRFSQQAQGRISVFLNYAGRYDMNDKPQQT